MPAILFALVSYLGWGIGDIFGTVATRKIGAYSATLWYLIFQFLISIPLAFFFFDNLKNLTPNLFVLNLVLGIIGTIGLVTFYEGLRIASASLVGTISASFAALVVILSVIFLKENIAPAQIISIVIIFAGMILSTLDFKDLKNKKFLTNKGIIFAILTMFLWGIYWTFIKIPVRELSWYWPGMISLSSFILVWLFMRQRKIKLVNFASQKASTPILLNAVLLGVGSFSFNFAIERGLTAIVAPIAGSYPTLFVILAFLIFKDPITRQQIAGIAITLVGIVLLSIASV